MRVVNGLLGALALLPGLAAAEQIGEHIGPHVTDMGIVIERGTTGIDAGFALMDGDEFLHPASQAVEQF